MKVYWWSTGSGFAELKFDSLEQAQSCAQGGKDASEDVKALRLDPRIAARLEAFDPEDVREILRDYGSWSEEELADHNENLSRLLWVACCDVAENPEEYEELCF